MGGRFCPRRERDNYFGSFRVVVRGGFAPGGRGTTSLAYLGSLLGEALPPEGEGRLVCGSPPKFLLYKLFCYTKLCQQHDGECMYERGREDPGRVILTPNYKTDTQLQELHPTTRVAYNYQSCIQLQEFHQVRTQSRNPSVNQIGLAEGQTEKVQDRHPTTRVSILLQEF